MSIIPNLTLSIDRSPKFFLHDQVEDDRFYEVVKAKLEDPNQVEDLGYTLLHRASWSLQKNSRIFKLLLERGANVNAATVYGHTPLHFAVSSRKRYAVVALIKAGAKVNPCDYSGRTALHFSISTNWTFPPIPVLHLPVDMWIVKRLLCHPEIDLNPKSNIGSTPLMFAVKTRNLHAVKELLKRGANLNISDIHKTTPLHRALYHQNPNFNIACVLLQKGAGIYCEDVLGRTPIDVLVDNVRENNRSSAKYVVWLIALLYRIEDSLKCKLKQMPELSDHFEKCHKEVRLMNSEMLDDKFTLHDFALNCYQTQLNDNNEDISTPVTPLLLAGSYVQYLDLILDRF